VFAALAEFERDLIRERTNAGLAAARARGRKGGRPSVMTPDKLAIAREMYASGEHTVAAIAAVVGVSRASVYRHLAPSDGPSAAGDAAAA
jgi:DNA invertase Pin-like site-specific DNA recombinase